MQGFLFSASGERERKVSLCCYSRCGPPELFELHLLESGLWGLPVLSQQLDSPFGSQGFVKYLGVPERERGLWGHILRFSDFKVIPRRLRSQV